MSFKDTHRIMKIFHIQVQKNIESKEKKIYDHYEYERNREKQYPSVKDQLDALYHDIKNGNLNDKTGNFSGPLQWVNAPAELTFISEFEDVNEATAAEFSCGEYVTPKSP